MTEPADQQPEPAWCLTEAERDGTSYICTRETHRGGSHKMIKRADMPDALRDALAARTVALLADDDTTDLVPTDTASALDATIAKRMHRTARLAERNRHTNLIDYEVTTGNAISDAILDLDESRWAENLTADVASLLRIKARVDAWLLQRGVTDEEAGS